MANWKALTEELDAWSDLGHEATLWWRDDDAIKPTENLNRLITTSKLYAIPLCLAIIPALAKPELKVLLRNAGNITVAVHGVTHDNLSPSGEKKSELANIRPTHEMATQVALGLEKLIGLSRDRAVPILVPPWNRIAESLIPVLPDYGFKGLSTFGERRARYPAPELLQVNCHVDPIDWRGDRGFIGVDAALDILINHFSRRRRGQCDIDEPTGLLTHHAVWAEDAFAFLEELFIKSQQHPAARWLSPFDIFRSVK